MALTLNLRNVKIVNVGPISIYKNYKGCYITIVYEEQEYSFYYSESKNLPDRFKRLKEKETKITIGNYYDINLNINQNQKGYVNVRINNFSNDRTHKI